jgi:hypothetical protein
MRVLKDFRNQIAQDYISEALVQFLDAILESISALSLIAEKTIQYCARYSPSSSQLNVPPV